MDLDTIPECRLEEHGVKFKYLVLRLTSGEHEKLVIRGVNFRPYEADASDRILQNLKSELEDLGYNSDQTQVEADGGGTAVVNPYSEIVTLFGENPKYGSETDRESAAGVLEDYFSGYKLHWYESGEEEAPARPKRKAASKAAAKAKKPASKKANADAKDADESADKSEKPT